MKPLQGDDCYLPRSKTMRVFLTGGSGYVGQRVIGRLLAEGHELRGHARSEAAAGKLRARGVQPVVCALTDEAALAQALIGQEAVVHVAAHFALWGKWDEFQAGIIDATLALHRAAQLAGVKRFVYISAAAVVGGALPTVVDERSPYPRSYNAFYSKAKALAEQALLAAPPSPMVTITLRPPLIWGGAMPVLDEYQHAVQQGQALWADGGRRTLDTIHVDNLVEAIVCGLSRGVDRAVYFVTDDDPTTVRAFFSALLATRGLAQGNRSLPGWLVRGMAALLEGLWQARGTQTPPPITRFFAEVISRDRRYDIGAAKSDLGYRPIITRAQGLAEMHTLYQQTSTSTPTPAGYQGSLV
jgi:nucleoside-diphosphate-sugar epimerase